MRSYGWTLLLVLFLGPASSLRAWNEYGHMAVAKVAWDQLDDGTKLRCATLLQAHPHYHGYLIRNKPKEVTVEEWAFLRAAIWPDWVRPRGEKEIRTEQITRYHRPEDHYTNTPIIFATDADQFQNPRPDPEQQDIVSAFRQRWSDLHSRSLTAEDKAVSLCWLLHLVGDVHQPLHAATLFSRDFQRGDLGGNSFGVKIGGQPWKLHSYWDNAFGDVPGTDDDPPDRQGRLYRRLQEAAELLRAAAYQPENLPELKENTNFPAWAQESYGWARKVAYQEGRLKGVVIPPESPVPAEAENADAEYEPAVRQLVRTRVALAGHRLAGKLTTIFQKK